MTFKYEEIASLDYFDSRDVVERIARINERIEKEMDSKNTFEVAHLRLERLVLHTILEELAEEFPPSKWSDVRTDVNCGVGGFAEHYAEEYAEEYAYDTGAVERDAWVEPFIDWEKVADALKEDYQGVEILGHTFYLRD